MFLALSGITLPLEDPILKFLLILAIILAAPLVLNKLRIPYLLGLIIAGAVIGPHGFNLVLRDSSIILSGTAGLLYIMFLSGLEMDVNDLRRNGWRSIVFGLYTFSIPMAFGILAGYYILGFALHSSILLAALFASQTLIAYPMVSKLGLARDKSVVIAVGGTMITDTLALLVLTVIVGLSTGKVDQAFWYRLSGSVVACIAGITLLFPLIGRWFFKHCSDNIAQYIFVLMMVFLGAFAAEAAGLEPIIGAFLAGLAMGRLIPRTSPLMNRIDFVGNAIFIPFFLISVGMLIDYRAFFKSWETLEVSAVMVVGVTAAKYLAAVLSQKTFRLSRDQRTLLFGLSTAHVAATLAAVMVGYNVILGHTPEGEPIRLLNESVLNGTILMIFFTCTISTFAAQRGAHNIALSGGRTEEPDEHDERILIPVANDETVEELVHLSTAIKTPRDKGGLFALNSVSNHLQDNGPDIKRAKTALRIAHEFGVRITLEHVTEGHLIVDELAKEKDVPMAVGPTLTHSSKFELQNKSWATPGVLAKAGCHVSIITDAPVIPLHYLPLCAGMAIKAGMDEYDALRAITINPAEHIGIADRVGSLEVGKDADVVILDGSPFTVEGEVRHVFINGSEIEL